MNESSEPSFKTSSYSTLDAASGCCIAVHPHGGVVSALHLLPNRLYNSSPTQASGTSNGKIQITGSRLSEACVSLTASSSSVIGAKWDEAGDVLAVCDSAAATASGKSSVTLLNTHNGKTKRIPAPEPVTCAAFPPEYSWDGPQAVVLGTAEGAVLIAKETSGGIFGQSACHQLHKDVSSGRVWDVQLCGSRVAWVTATGLKVHDVDCGVRLLVDKSPLQPQLAALVGEQVPPRLAWLGPEWLAVAWGNRVLVYSVGAPSVRGATPVPAAVIRCADLHTDGFVVGMAPFGPSRILVLHAALGEGGAMGLHASLWPRVFKGGEGGAPEASEPLHLGANPNASDWLPCDFGLAFHPRFTIGSQELGVSSGPERGEVGLTRVFVRTPAEVFQVKPRTLFDHVQWCDDQGFVAQALQVALTLPVPSPRAAVSLLQRDTAARLLSGRVQEALGNAPRLWMWAVAPPAQSGASGRSTSFSLTALAGAFGGGASDASNSGAEQRNTMQQPLGALTAWYLWLLGSVPLLSSKPPPPAGESGGGPLLTGQVLDDTRQLCEHALGSVWCDDALLQALLSRGASASVSAKKLPELVSKCVPAAKGGKGGSRRHSVSASARHTDEQSTAWHPVSAALAAASGLGALWICRRPDLHLAVARTVLRCLPVLDAPIPSVVFENILHVLVWLQPDAVGPVLKQWGALSQRGGGQGSASAPLCSAEAVTATIQAALKARAAAAADRPQTPADDDARQDARGFSLGVPPFVPTREALEQLQLCTQLSGLPAPLLPPGTALQAPEGKLFSDSTSATGEGAKDEQGTQHPAQWGPEAAQAAGLMAQPLPEQAKSATARTSGALQAPFGQQHDNACTITETPEQFEQNTATLLDVLAEQLMQSGRHRTALRVVLQRASSMMLQSERASHLDAFGFDGSLDIQSSQQMQLAALVPKSSGRYAFVFRIIQEQKLFEECLTSLQQLLALDAMAALAFSVRHISELKVEGVLRGVLGQHTDALLGAKSATTVHNLVRAAPSVTALQLRSTAAFVLLLASSSPDGWGCLGGGVAQGLATAGADTACAFCAWRSHAHAAAL